MDPLNTGWQFAIEDPAADDIAALIGTHLSDMADNTPPESVHALDISALQAPEITFFTLRDADLGLIAIGALKDMGNDHAELKSMHTAAAARGRGAGKALLEHVITVARDRGLRQIWLETGAFDAHAPSRRLYARAGFEPCEPFAEYADDPHSAYMMLRLEGFA